MASKALANVSSLANANYLKRALTAPESPPKFRGDFSLLNVQNVVELRGLIDIANI